MRLPLSTYRLQLSHQFTFSQVEALVPYFEKLGITDLYLSPILQAQPSSTHGYDTVDYAAINSELGGIEGLRKLSHRLQEHHLGLCVDIVPNHMAATQHNLYWSDVIQRGKESQYSYLFDIKWNYSTATTLVYRRFFDVNELVCLKTEEDAVFNFTHHLIIQLVNEQIITGLRIDHLDGLRAPATYLKKLDTAITTPIWVIAEKILGLGEKLPSTWHLSGTTGYDFLNELNQIFVCEQGLAALNNYYNQLTANKESITQIKIRCLRLVITTLFKNEFQRLSESLQELLGGDATVLLLQFSSLMPVYRLYQQKDTRLYNEDIINQIFKQMNGDNNQIMSLFKSLLLDDYPTSFDREKIKKWQQWRNDWEVFTGPVMAKGFEDTTCYNYYAFLAVNEVGSAPYYFDSGGRIDKFHDFNVYKQHCWPSSLNATSTHDTKRSEDMRARLNVLTELSTEWNRLLKEWRVLNQDKKMTIDAMACPDIVDEILIYQTLIGIWPLEYSATDQIEERLNLFLVKAFRERKCHSSWANPNQEYEQSAFNFTKLIFSDSQFITAFLCFQKKVAFLGMYNSLSQLILKMTCPGIPDFYQGSESWCFTVVDPDNRGIVDFADLEELDSHESLPILLHHWQDGRIKFNLTKRLLSIRNQFKEIFLHGDYHPLTIYGEKSNNIIAFIRRHNDEWVAVITCRWFSELTASEKQWSSACFANEYGLLPGHYISLLSKAENQTADPHFLIKDLLTELPFAILKNT